MNKMFAPAALAAVCVSAPAAAVIKFDPPPSIQLTTIVEGTNLPSQTSAFTFTSTGDTGLTFYGYNDSISNIGLFLNGTGPNLLNATGFGSSTVPGSGSTSNIGSDGSLNFTGTTFSDTFFTSSTFAAGNYTLNYALTGNGGPNGLRIVGTNVSNVVPIAAVPEPATWAMMLIGFGGIAFQMRRQRKPVLAQIA